MLAGGLFARAAGAVAAVTGNPCGLLAAGALSLLSWWRWGIEPTVLWITIVTWLQLFPLQYTQTRDTAAMQKKLDGLIRAIDKADDRLAGIEREEC